MAIGLGACVLEKHFTLDNQLPGPDHLASANPAEMADYVACVRDAESALGNWRKVPSRAENENLVAMRRSIVARVDLSARSRIELEDLAFEVTRFWNNC